MIHNSDSAWKFLMAIPQSAVQVVAVAALACFWLSALKPLLAKKPLRMWRQVTGGLSLGVGFGAAFFACVLSLGPMG